MKKKKEIQTITIIDKEIPYSLFEEYLRAMWVFMYDKPRAKAHQKIFDALNIYRYDYENENYNPMDYENAIDDVVAHGFNCCGLPVQYDNSCRAKDCDNILDVNQSEKNMLLYCMEKNWRINNNG